MEQKNITERTQIGLKNNTERIHRVGSITAGTSMVIWGALFILYELRVVTELDFVLRLWPLILVGLGIEILWYNAKDKNMVYDKGAVFLMFIMSGFSVMMAVADKCLTYIK